MRRGAAASGCGGRRRARSRLPVGRDGAGRVDGVDGEEEEESLPAEGWPKLRVARHLFLVERDGLAVGGGTEGGVGGAAEAQVRVRGAEREGLVPDYGGAARAMGRGASAVLVRQRMILRLCVLRAGIGAGIVGGCGGCAQLRASQRFNGEGWWICRGVGFGAAVSELC